jgi:hypothetical protein
MSDAGCCHLAEPMMTTECNATARAKGAATAAPMP